MLPGTNLTFGSIVNVVVLGDSDVAKLSKFVLMMLCSETPPNFFSSCFLGESVVCSVCEIGVAEATPENVRAPITPTTAAIRYLRSRIRPPLSRRPWLQVLEYLPDTLVPSIHGRFPSKRDMKRRMRPLHLGVDFLQQCFDVLAVSSSIVRLNASTFSRDTPYSRSPAASRASLLVR